MRSVVHITKVSNTHDGVEGELHPFGGCNKLAGQYRIIGRELLTFEQHSGLSSLTSPGKSETAFRQGISFIPVEVLESYFDDLLDIGQPDSILHIESKSWIRRPGWMYVAVLGMLVALLMGLYVASLGTSLPIAFSLAVSLCIPFAAMLYIASNSASRRMRFAQLLSREIYRRRGINDDSTLMTGARIGLRSLLSAQAPQSTAGASFELLN